MGREHGSLAPGLGSAVSTLHLEYGGGDRVELPGTVYSKVSLTGELQSNLLVEPSERCRVRPSRSRTGLRS